LKAYGEERRARPLARAIVTLRKEKRIKTTLDLVDVIHSVTGSTQHQKIHPATRTFQALRIEVNNELGVLGKTIPDATALLSPEGRFGIITFHSLEDRIVKQGFKQLSSTATPLEGPDPEDAEPPPAKLLTRKPVLPSKTESKRNPRSRCAKMRFIEKL
jgi:16S rRNA (cytosine1402-N4)-methyltransferase